MNLVRLRTKRFADRALAPRGYPLVLAALLCFCGAFATPATAATITMAAIDNGPCPSSHNSSATQCWDLGRAPITGDDVVMNSVAGSSSAVTNYDLAASVQLHSITIRKGGGSIGLQSGGFFTDNNSNGGTDLFINAGFTLHGPATFTLDPLATPLPPPLSGRMDRPRVQQPRSRWPDRFSALNPSAPIACRPRS